MHIVIKDKNISQREIFNIFDTFKKYFKIFTSKNYLTSNKIRDDLRFPSYIRIYTLT